MPRRKRHDRRPPLSIRIGSPCPLGYHTASARRLARNAPGARGVRVKVVTVDVEGAYVRLVLLRGCRLRVAFMDLDGAVIARWTRWRRIGRIVCPCPGRRGVTCRRPEGRREHERDADDQGDARRPPQEPPEPTHLHPPTRSWHGPSEAQRLRGHRCDSRCTASATLRPQRRHPAGERCLEQQNRPSALLAGCTTRSTRTKVPRYGPRVIAATLFDCVPHRRDHDYPGHLLHWNGRHKKQPACRSGRLHHSLPPGEVPR